MRRWLRREAVVRSRLGRVPLGGCGLASRFREWFRRLGRCCWSRRPAGPDWMRRCRRLWPRGARPARCVIRADPAGCRARRGPGRELPGGCGRAAYRQARVEVRDRVWRLTGEAAPDARGEVIMDIDERRLTRSIGKAAGRAGVRSAPPPSGVPETSRTLRRSGPPAAGLAGLRGCETLVLWHICPASAHRSRTGEPGCL